MSLTASSSTPASLRSAKVIEELNERLTIVLQELDTAKLQVNGCTARIRCHSTNESITELRFEYSYKPQRTQSRPMKRVQSNLWNQILSFEAIYIF
jgi:hypothetical protein